jgi:DHA1 family tetracycline resistance protein-like MFS transporter
MKRIKRIVIFTLFLDMLGMTIMIPAFPNLVAYYDTSYFMISLGVTLFSLFGLFSTPILGAISDKYGRKIVLLVSVISSLLSYGLIWISGNIRVYLIARIVNGAAAGNISSIQSILSDIAVDHKERTANFGLF